MALAQSNTGTFSGTPFTVTLPAASNASNRLVLFVTGNTLITTPSGWTLRTSQVNEMGHYLFDRAGDGGTSWSVSGSAGQGVWWIGEVEAGVYNTAAGQNNISSSTSYTTPTIVPSSGAKILLASLGSLRAGSDARTVGSWLNSFVEVSDNCYVGADNPSGATASREVVGDGSTGYSTGATYSLASTGRSALIASYVTSSGVTPVSASGSAVVVSTATGTVSGVTVKNATGSAVSIAGSSGVGVAVHSATGSAASIVATSGLASVAQPASGVAAVSSSASGVASDARTASGSAPTVSAASGVASTAHNVAAVVPALTLASGSASVSGVQNASGVASSATTTSGTAYPRHSASAVASVVTASTGTALSFHIASGVAYTISTVVGAAQAIPPGGYPTIPQVLSLAIETPARTLSVGTSPLLLSVEVSALTLEV